MFPALPGILSSVIGTALFRTALLVAMALQKLAFSCQSLEEALLAFET